MNSQLRYLINEELLNDLKGMILVPIPVTTIESPILKFKEHGYDMTKYVKLTSASSIEDFIDTTIIPEIDIIKEIFIYQILCGAECETGINTPIDSNIDLSKASFDSDIYIKYALRH